MKKSSSLPAGVSVAGTRTIPGRVLPALSSVRTRWAGDGTPTLSSGRPMFHVEAAARTVSYPSFSSFHRKIPMGTRTFSIGVTPRSVHSASGVPYSFMKALAPGGSVLMSMFSETFESSSASFGSFPRMASARTARR